MYKITKVENNQITLSFDGREVNFPLPMVDGLYPTGEALTTLLETYVTNARLAAQVNTIQGSNLAELQALITPPTAEQVATKIKIVRNRLLMLTDWTQVGDCVLTIEQKTAWAAYRVELRNLTTQTGFPVITWPVPPAVIVNPMGLIVVNVDGTPKI